MATQLKINTRTKQVKIFVEQFQGVSLDMILIPGGTFKMGTPEEEIDRLCKEYDVDYFRWEGPQHQVKVPLFFMGRYPITQEQWRAIARLDPVAKTLETDPSEFKGDKLPIERVSWQDAIEFCARLSKETGKKYRLPSEAEWEYACRAGTETPFHFGETISTELANYNGREVYGRGEKGIYRQKTTEVNLFDVANEFGLSDMHGNVLEWCLDPWHENYEGAPEDGKVWEEESDNDNRYQNILDSINKLIDDQRTHVLRGGSWLYAPWNCRSAYRFVRGRGRNSVGFRVVCAPS